MYEDRQIRQVEGPKRGQRGHQILPGMGQEHHIQSNSATGCSPICRSRPYQKSAPACGTFYLNDVDDVLRHENDIKKVRDGLSK